MSDDQFNEQLQKWLDRFNAGDPQAKNRLIMHVNDRLGVWVSKGLADHSRAHRFETTQDLRQEVLKRLNRSLSRVRVTTPDDFFDEVGKEIALALADLERRVCRGRGIATRHESWPPSQSNSAEQHDTGERVTDSEEHASDHGSRPVSQDDSSEECDTEEKLTDSAELDRWHTWPPLQSDSTDEVDVAEKVKDPAVMYRHARVLEEIERLPQEQKKLAHLLWINGFPKKKVAAMLGVHVQTVRNWAAALKDRLERRVML